ncbi:MAG TPA: prepilin-type N-terminal cleavage/methylation domain-containing protein [Gemmatimonadaceae bacterium]
MTPRFRARRAHVRPRRRRQGFILMEVIVGITLLALVMTPLAAMVFKITQRSHRIIGGAYRNGVLMQQVNLLESLPYDSLAIGTTSSSSTAMPYPYTRTITITETFRKYEVAQKQIKLIITPTNPLYRPDTAIIVRSTANTLRTFLEDDPPPQ